MKTLLIITLLFILMTPAPSSANETDCPATDISGQGLTSGAWAANGNLRCVYGKPYNLTLLCASPDGVFVYKARIVGKSLRCFYQFYRQPN